MKKKTLSLLFFFFVLTSAFCGIMERPRKVFIISTKYFEILFSEKSTYTAQLLSENADALYELAQNDIKIENNRKISVIISPDSDVFSVTYTPHPYNRIIIYEALPEYKDSFFEDVLLSGFYNELRQQVFQNIKGDFETSLYKFLKADVLQPVYLENLPFSFLEGIQFLDREDSETINPYTKNFNDGFFLQILSQAKLEDKFPTFIQACGSMDIYPGKEIAQACGAAFTAYIQQRWGYKKFYDFCMACGSFNLYSTEGIFFKTYEIPLNQAWAEFEDSIPLPSDLENLKYLESQSEEILSQDNKGFYEHLLYSPYGIIWYDKFRHEVAIYNPDNNLFLSDLSLSGLSGRKLLFLAEDITNLSLSNDGRFLAVSLIKNGLRDNLKKNKTWIYDLRNRIFIGEHLDLRDACIVKLKDNTYGIAGIYDNNGRASIRIYSSEKLNSLHEKEIYNTTENDFETELLYEKEFDYNSIPYSLVYTTNGNLFSILNSRKNQYLYNWNFYEDEDSFFEIDKNQTKNANIKIRNLSINKNPYQNTDFYSSILTFEYGTETVENIANYSRLGFIFLDKNIKPSQIWCSENNVSGGMNYPILKDHDLYYSSIRYDHSEIIKLKINLLDFQNVAFSEKENIQAFRSNQKISYYNDEIFQNELMPYHQFSEIFKGSVNLFMPIREISVENKAELWPGLGFTFKSLSDRYANNKIYVSAGLGYLDLTYEKYSNPTERILHQIEQAKIENGQNYSAAVLYENSSTAADIFAGALYKGTKKGDYNLKGLIGTSLIIPLGMKFRSLGFNFQMDYTAATNFRDIIYSEVYPSLSEKTKLFKSYQDISASLKIEYTNIHQFGFSPYELRGISAALTTNIFWDLGLSEVSTTNEELLLRAQQFTNNSFIKPSQINIGFSASAKIPQLSFIKDYNNWILCFPTSVDFDLFNKNGTAMNVRIETLLCGKEIQTGFNFLHLYFSRFGLKAAYDFGLVYDETKVALPDLRDFSKFYHSFVNTTIEDKLSATAQLDFIPAIGFLSSALLHTDFIFEYYLRSKTTKFTISLNLNY